MRQTVTVKHRHTNTPEGVTKVHLPYLQEFRPCAAQRNKAPLNRFWRSRFNEAISCRRSCLMLENPGSVCDDTTCLGKHSKIVSASSQGGFRKHVRIASEVRNRERGPVQLRREGFDRR